MTHRLWSSRAFVITLGLVLAFGFPAAADDPQVDEKQPAANQQEQTQSTTSEEPELKSLGSAKGGSSLAAAAAGIKLTQPPSDGAPVISNANLQKSGGKGAMSVGGGVSAASAAQATGSATAKGGSNPANALVQQYNEQLRTVESLEARLKNVDEQLEPAARDPHYPYVTARPHDRAPGVQDPASAQRDAVAKQLEAERAKLNTLRDRARRQGVQLD
jgi:hypothetical protein